MSDRDALKPCAACGANVAVSEGHDADSTFLCPACSSASQTAAPAKQRGDSPRRCTFCSRTVARKDCHKNRYGEYVCVECQKKGLRWSPGRHFPKVAKKVVRYALIGLIGLSVAAGYVWLFVKMINFVSQPPPPPTD